MPFGAGKTSCEGFCGQAWSPGLQDLPESIGPMTVFRMNEQEAFYYTHAGNWVLLSSLNTIAWWHWKNELIINERAPMANRSPYYKADPWQIQVEYLRGRRNTTQQVRKCDQERKEVIKGSDVKPDTTVGNWGLVPWINSGAQWKTRASDLSHPRGKEAGLSDLLTVLG